MKLIKIFDVLFWLLILGGLIKGLYLTYNSHKDVKNNLKKEQLQHWVVFLLIIISMPIIEKILGWIMFPIVVHIIKLSVLIFVVFSRNNNCVIYEFLDKQFSSFFEPRIKTILALTESCTRKECGYIILYSTLMHQWLTSLLICNVSPDNFQSLTENIHKTLQIVEEAKCKGEIKDLKEKNKNNLATNTEKS